MGGLKKKKRVENNDHKRRRAGNPGPLAEQVIKTNEGKETYILASIGLGKLCRRG